MSTTTRKVSYELKDKELQVLDQAIDVLGEVYNTIEGLCQLNVNSYICEGFDLLELRETIESIEYIIATGHSVVDIADEDI